MINTGMERSNFEDTASATCEGSFRYQTEGALARGSISLLVALKESGVKLTALDAYDGSGTFVQRGTVTFEVSGTEAEVEGFRSAYES